MTDYPTALLGAGAAVAAVSAAVIVAWLHVATRAYDVVRHGVSAYGVGDHAPWYRAQVVMTGTSALLLVAALVRHTPASAASLTFLGAYAVSRVAIARYPTDLEGEPVTRTGAIHALLAAVSFASLAAAAPLVALSITAAEVGGHDPTLLAFSVAVTAAALATFSAGLLPAVRPVFGLVERAFYATSLVWLAAIGLALAAGHA